MAGRSIGLYEPWLIFAQEALHAGLRVLEPILIGGGEASQGPGAVPVVSEARWRGLSCLRYSTFMDLGPKTLE